MGVCVYKYTYTYMVTSYTIANAMLQTSIRGFGLERRRRAFGFVAGLGFRSPNPKAQNGPKALYNMVFRPKSLFKKISP